MLKKSKNISIKEHLELLWHEQFFASPKKVIQVQEAIANKGYNIPSRSLSTALVRAVKKGEFIIRKKDAKGWTYQQKRPSDSPVTINSTVAYGYDLHPKIKDVSLSQFGNGHYKESIQNAFVEVIDQVKVRTGHPKGNNGRDLDGDDLMNHIFGCDNREPIIKFNPLQTSLDRAEQRGFMNLFKGIVGIRDRKAHLNFVQNDPFKTIEYLALASLLMRLLDENSAPISE